MNVTMRSTRRIVHVNGVPGRVWEGQTEAGIRIVAVITRVAVAQELQTDESRELFQRELLECAEATQYAVDAFPLRMVI